VTDTEAQAKADEESFRAYEAAQPFAQLRTAVENLGQAMRADALAALERLARWLGLRLP
jgi:hypothetical protein